MLNERTRMLVTTFQKLLHRKAYSNIKKIMAKTHNADIAEVLQSIGVDEALEVFKLDASIDERADILSYLDKNLQKFILSKLSDQEAAEVVQAMETDDAADLLSHLSDDASKTIIESLDSEESTEVVDLMGYPEESAGGIMSSDFLAFPEATTVGEVVQALHGEEAENKVTFYVYVVNRTDHLVGVVSLKQLLLSRKSAKLSQLMATNTIYVSTDTDQEQVAETVARYDFLSVPVVDKNNCLVGVITVDDVIDVIKQEAEEDLLSMAQAGWGVDMSWFEHFVARLPWLLLSFLVGGICFSIILYKGPQEESWALAAIIPLMLSLGAMAGNQTATVLLGALQTGQYWGGKLWVHIFREFSTGLILSVFFGSLVYFSTQLILPEIPWHFHFGLALGLQILLATILGSVLPVFMNKLKFDPLVLTPPIYSSIADIAAMSILFGIYSA